MMPFIKRIFQLGKSFHKNVITTNSIIKKKSYLCDIQFNYYVTAKHTNYSYATLNYYEIKSLELWNILLSTDSINV